MDSSPEIRTAKQFAEAAASTLRDSTSFQQLDADTRTALLRDLVSIRRALANESDPYSLAQRRYESVNSESPREIPSATLAATQLKSRKDPYVLTLETPNDLMRRRALLRQGQQNTGTNNATDENQQEETTVRPRAAATETLAARAGALSDEINFPAFVASLIHGTFDAMVDAAIRQMEAFAELVSAVAKDVDRFTSENVTSNQVRDWLAEQYPRDLVLDLETGSQPTLRRRTLSSETDEDEAYSPIWFADYGLEGEELNDELIEGVLVPMARRRVGENRLQTLATMVLMGMNRIIVRDGTIAAKVRFRAAARDKASVDFAISQDPGGQNWGSRGGSAYNNSAMMVSTVGVNVQAESELKAELFGEVRINFISETLPLDRFVDAAQLTLLQRNARGTNRNPRIQETNTPSPAPDNTAPPQNNEGA